MSSDELSDRLTRVEDELAIRSLAARYTSAIDDRNLAAVGELFTPQAVFRSRDGVMNAEGRDAIVKQFKGRYRVLDATNHVTQDHVVRFDGEGGASGLVSSHAELWRKERMMVTALRYADRYQKVGGVWRFMEWIVSFLYYVPAAEYHHVLGGLERNLDEEQRQAADYPERLATWTRYA